MKIVPLSNDLLVQVKLFTDQHIGEGYFSLEEHSKNLEKSTSDDGTITSFVLIDDNRRVHGLRLAFPPGKWHHGKGKKLRPDLWSFSLEQAGYFQSLFVSEEVQGFGYGPEMSQMSLDLFKKLGAKGVITHCWKESPHNSSYKYLSKAGFKTIIEHPHYWIDIDYVCTLDGKPCKCTAIEMALTFEATA